MTSQLSIDFDTPSRTVRASAVRNRSRVEYHAESSLIELNRYSIKLSFNNRSYMVRGVYHITQVSHLRDDQISRIVDYVGVDRIFTYRNGQYIVVPLLRAEESHIVSAVKDILKDPYNNAFLTVSHDRSGAF